MLGKLLKHEFRATRRSVGMVILGSNSMPLPGGVGVSDYLFLNLFESLAEDPAQLDLLARGISFYGCILLCALALALSLILQKKKGGSQAGLAFLIIPYGSRTRRFCPRLSAFL